MSHQLRTKAQVRKRIILCIYCTIYTNRKLFKFPYLLFGRFSNRKNQKTNMLFETTCYSHTTCTLFNLNGLSIIFVLMSRLSKYYIEITRIKTCLIDLTHKERPFVNTSFHFCTRPHGSPIYTSIKYFIIFRYKANTLAWVLQKSKIFWKQLWSDVCISYSLHNVGLEIHILNRLYLASCSSRNNSWWVFLLSLKVPKFTRKSTTY